MSPEDVNAWIAKRLAEAPPLSPMQRARLRDLLCPAVVATVKKTRTRKPRRKVLPPVDTGPPEAA